VLITSRRPCRRSLAWETVATNSRGRRGWHVCKRKAMKARNHWLTATALLSGRGTPCISRCAAKAGCVGQWGRWGRLRDEEPHSKSGSDRGPLVDKGSGPMGGTVSTTSVPEPRTWGRAKDGCKRGKGTANAGKQLNPFNNLGRRQLKCPHLSRIGENPPYGI
jgi:hypothetical protein